MKLQVASDFHLDVNAFIHSICNTGVIPNTLLNSKDKQDTVLILAGDICNAKFYRELVAILSPLWKEIIIVPGNHEFYGWDIASALDLMRTAVEPFANVTLLNNQSHQIDKITFLGSIGWAPTLTIPKVNNYINDFTWIKEFRENTHTCQELHDESIAWITRTLEQTKSPKVLITHFGQISLSIPNRFVGNPVNKYFITGALDTVEHKPELFIHGHTHISYKLNRYSYRLVCNPFGYGNENWQFNPDLIVTL